MKIKIKARPSAYITLSNIVDPVKLFVPVSAPLQMRVYVSILYPLSRKLQQQADNMLSKDHKQKEYGMNMSLHEAWALEKYLRHHMMQLEAYEGNVAHIIANQLNEKMA
jgi:hypothetical protein